MSDRRAFLRCSACGVVGLAALTIPGCGGEGPTGPVETTPRDTTTVKKDTTTKKTTDNPTEAKWEISGATVRVFLARVPELATIPGFVLIDPAQTIVVRTGETDYSAFTAVCTHEGCFVASFVNNRLVCPCHGSTFGLDGSVLVGPALLPLAQFTTAFDAAKNELLVSKSV